MWQPHRRHWVMCVVVAAAAVGLSASNPDVTPAPPDYEVASLKGKLMREDPQPEVELAVGAHPTAGELLRTGRRSRAEIVVEEAGARFALGPSTRARLASQRPGVLLELERGRLRAIFDKLAADPPPERMVITPSAVLAVRGTEYGVEVTRRGDTDLVVFKGVVEVRNPAGEGEWVRVQAGFHVRVRHGQPVVGQPTPHGLGPSDWDRGRRPPSAQGPVGWGPGANAPGQGGPADGRPPGGPGANAPGQQGPGGRMTGGPGTGAQAGGMAGASPPRGSGRIGG